MTAVSLSIVGHIDVPAAVRTHRFHAEAEANAMMLAHKNDPSTQVVGTENTRRCELYGWAPNVDSHRDDSGWMYLVLLTGERSIVEAYASPKLGSRKVHSVRIRPGDVLRLWDHCLHWTIDDGYRVAAFVGSFPRPADAEALATLRAGVEALASGAYYGAPRVRPGFRAMQDDECLVSNAAFDDLEPALLADAQAQGRFIETCAHCDRPAVRADEKWPFFHDMSRCRLHLQGASA